MLRGKSVLVTGAGGFIGWHLVQRLAKEGAIVHATYNRLNWRVKDLPKGVKHYIMDLTRYDNVSAVLAKAEPEIVYHLGAMVNPARHPDLMDEMIKVNLMGTVNLLRSIEWNSCAKFINTGTCEEYGDGIVPFSEDQKPNPVSPYSASKAASTMFCSMMRKTQDLPIVTVRPFLTYGPMQDGKMLIPSLMSAVANGGKFTMTKGEQTREFNFVDDIVEGYILVSTVSGVDWDVINIGNGVEYRVIDVARMVLDLMDSDTTLDTSLPYRKGEAMRFFCDNSKVKRLLGWKARVGLEEGLKRTVEWYKGWSG